LFREHSLAAIARYEDAGAVRTNSLAETRVRDEMLSSNAGERVFCRKLASVLFCIR